jgi:hypothetical protein
VAAQEKPAYGGVMVTRQLFSSFTIWLVLARWNYSASHTATAVVKKHPVGCRQRNVVRRMVCPSVDKDLSQVRDPEIRAFRSWFKEYLNKERDEAERNRLACLKNAV